MASVNPPYFFDEYLRPITRKHPTDRERALGLTLKDVNWLGTVYTASHRGRQDRDAPMLIETLIVQRSGKPATPLAGAFMMSSSPEEKKAVLYTPYGGIEVFDHRGDCLAALTQRLQDPAQHMDLVRFLPLAQRNEFNHKSPFTLGTATVEHGVFEEQENTIKAHHAQDVQHLLAQLRTTPALPELLDAALESLGAVLPHFHNLTLKDTRVNSFLAATDGDALPHWVASASLNETLLEYYVNQAWPADRTRTFTHPRYDSRGLSGTRLQQPAEHWENLVQQAAGVLSKLLKALLLTWWHEPIGQSPSRPEYSRMDLFTQVMSDKFRADLLFKRQSESEILSSEEAHSLLAVFLPDQASRSAWHQALRIEKVNIHAPYQHYVELAATLLISDRHAYLYTQSRGLQVLKDVEDLNDTLLSMLKAAGHQDELLNFLSLDERRLYLAMRGVQVSGQSVEGSVFGEMVNAIQEKQLSNLEHALTLFRRSEGAVNLTALLDCALDIRHMLDSRLLDLDAAGRWSLHPVSSGNGRPSTVQAERAKLQLTALQADEDILVAQRAGHPTLRSLARSALNREMKSRHLGLDARDVYINTYPTEAQDREERPPESSVNMLEHFIAHLANATAEVGSTPRIGFYGPRHDGAALSWNSLNSHLFNAIITQVATQFVEHDVRTLPRQFLNLHGERMLESLMHGLRSEAQLRRLNNTLSPNHHAILDTVLRADSMTRDKRHGLQGFLPDAFSLTLTQGDDTTRLPLANCFVLTERGGLDPTLSGNVVLWTPQRGHEPFASLTTLNAALEQRLRRSVRRNALLQNLPVNLRTPHQRYRLGPLQRIDGHFLENRQYSNLDHHLAAIDYWLTLPLGPTQLQDHLDAEMQLLAPSNIDRAKTLANAMIEQQALPAWLGMASANEQLLHAELLEQYRLNASDNQDYLHSLPTLREQVAGTLTRLLKARFPNDALNPENILIPARVALNGHTQSLTDFALRHLPQLLPDQLTPSARDGTPLPASLDGSAVVQLVRQLDIGNTYRGLLETHLKADTDDARQRRELFCRQLPWQLLRYAHEEKLEERLSASAWGFIQQIFDMPDAVARDAIDGATAMIRPLELVATPGATPAKVLGVYLIGPRAGAVGPLILYAPYAPLPALKEYGTEEKLLEDLHTTGLLQDWIVRQLEDPARAIFRNRLQQPQHQEAPEHKEDAEKVGLASNPIRANVLLRMFYDNAEQLIKMLACQFDPDGKGLWEGVTSLLRKGVPVLLQFIAGKLKYPLVVWRSFKLFEASAEDLQEQRFGEGLRTFIQGLARLASLRQQLDDSLEPDDLAAQSTPMPSATTVTTLDITEPTRTRMRHFEDVAVALADLREDPGSHVYQQAVSGRGYVPMAGKVYRVIQKGEHWCLSAADATGPCVKRDARGQWVLDLSRHDVRYGPALSRYRADTPIQREVNAMINIEASGRINIRKLSRFFDDCIESALGVAIFYTHNCQRNLVLFRQAPYPRVASILADMFGIARLSGQQLAKIDRSVSQVLSGLLEHSLLDRGSDRFVYGHDRQTLVESMAFVIPVEVRRKIYLVDRFFHPRLYPANFPLRVPFDIDEHARAATLIHEMSHLVSDTENIAYLDSARPFLDLFDPNTPQYADLYEVQNTTLSHLTPLRELFTVEDWWGGFQDLKDPARARVLSLTGTQTLTDARNVFMADPDRRLDVILANADSVAYLITYVGRRLDPGAT
ncbi:dermonecrotic toxin domain-containing protein [Pseudomonas sp. B22129]|uniref:dermonecrotic toxin domain-containing protein n=1 Tax=Pseudomonas sp. B22129 TaxID=3235111 RepID=UPI0037852966